MTSILTQRQWTNAVKNPRNIIYADIRHIGSFPDSYKLEWLCCLHLTECYSLDSLDAFRDLPVLSELRVTSCQWLLRVDNLPVSLRKLHLDSCDGIRDVRVNQGLLELKIMHCNPVPVPSDLPISITELVMWSTNSTSLPDMAALQMLKRIDLSFSWWLASLHALFGLLPIKTLNLSYCTALTELPESFGELGQLEYVDFDSCRSLAKLPEAFGQLAMLDTLNIGSCELLTELPESLGQLARLTLLNAVGCHSMARLPKSIGQMSALQTLFLRDCAALTCLPDSLCQLAALESLVLDECKLLTGLPARIDQLLRLRQLSMVNCISVTKLPESIGHLAALELLELENCKQIERLPESFGQLSALQRFSFGGYNHQAPFSFPFSFWQLSPLLDYRINVSCQFPPPDIFNQGMQAICQYIIDHNTPMKILILILVGRRSRSRARPKLPNELWVLIRDEFL